MQIMVGRIQTTKGRLARKQLSALREAGTTGCPLDISFPLSNIILITVIVASQLTQYTLFHRKTRDVGNAGDLGDDLTP